MKLEQHVAYDMIKNDNFAKQIVDRMYSYAVNTEEFIKSREILHNLVSPEGQRAYVITDSIGEKLLMLKVKQTREYEIQKRVSHDVIGRATTYDWSVFNHISNRKVTLIFSQNSLLRIMFDAQNISFCFVVSTFKDGRQTDIRWSLWYVNKLVPYLSQNWNDVAIQDKLEFVYKTMCFLYLSENEELIVPPGHRYGTKKHGKVVNGLPMPVTVVTSKWNVTSIRTEGFDVSGHFRLQPTKTGTKMIFIDPFRKHGYVRKAKSETEK